MQCLEVSNSKFSYLIRMRLLLMTMCHQESRFQEKHF